MSHLSPCELERLFARQKSYTGACILVLLLYLFCWVPGVIANHLYLAEALRQEEIAGERLPGVAGLKLMWNLAGLVFLVVLAFFIAVLIDIRRRSPL